MRTDSNHALMRQLSTLRAIPRWPARATVAELCSTLLEQGYTVSKRTVERDLHALSLMFEITADERSKPYGWSWMKDASFCCMPGLTPAQSVALMLARAHVDHFLPQNLQRELAPVFESAERGLMATGWRDWHRRTAVLPSAMALIPPRISTEVMGRVQSALAQGVCIEADYRSKGQNSARKLRIHPLGMLSRGPVLYLVCTVFDYQDVRQLAMHRLAKVALLADRRREPMGFDFSAYVNGIGTTLGASGRILLVARFTRAAGEHLLESPLSRDQTWEVVEDGERVEVTATVEHDDHLEWWLLGFGPHVVVYEPPALRATLSDRHHLAALQYDNMISK
ncbi:MAG: WYL domain-containing protein [Gammaproteobacteria bacterium HGW-Gammaproteobacteria-1]|jgi:predicted DNA-binding transcriptional regulator YafY|nr:MAG: WYL domain-containing protein [Gammaproteobacteria bacterium HGW-Gammaproteobacteria-2]PKM42084.1 MAG: WYL domain-containing protein [Gammaproteobacteria bacterium HGW-Gammaproteobacteria-1]